MKKLFTNTEADTIIQILASSSTLVVNMVRSKHNMVAGKKLSPQGKQDIGREEKRKMKRRMLLAIMFLICIVVPLIYAGTFILKISPRELFLRCVFAGYILTQKPPPMPTPSELFIEHLLDPIPKSVKNIRAHKYGVTGKKYTMCFNINKDDLDLIVNSRPFIKVWDVKYEDGRLSWGWDSVGLGSLKIPKYGHSMTLYGSGRGPRWFRPDLWDNFEAYGLHKEGDLVNTEIYERDKRKSINGWTTTQVLLFNKKEGEAYFIFSSWSK